MALTGGDDDSSKEEEETPTPVPSSSQQPSVINVVLLWLILLGIGTLCGFGIFWVQLSGLQSGESTWKSEYEKAIQETQQCLADTSDKDELNKLQSRLAAQEELAERREALLVEQQESLKQVTELQDRIRSLESQLLEREQEFKEIGMQMTTMSSQLSLHNSQVNECTERLLPALAEDARRMKSYIMERNIKTCQMEFGKGPYYVEFTVQLPDTEEPSLLEVKLSPLMDMPHTLATFLTLIDLQLYDGTKFRSTTDGKRILGGDPAEAKNPSLIIDRYQKFGLRTDSSLMAFSEQSQTVPPTPFTLCFVDGTSLLAINMVDLSKNTADWTASNDICFGKVIGGFNILTRLRGDADIVHARLNRAPRK